MSAIYPPKESSLELTGWVQPFWVFSFYFSGRALFLMISDQVSKDFPYDRSVRRALLWFLPAALNSRPRSGWFSNERSLVSFQTRVSEHYTEKHCTPPHTHTEETDTPPPLIWFKFISRFFDWGRRVLSFIQFTQFWKVIWGQFIHNKY